MEPVCPRPVTCGEVVDNISSFLREMFLSKENIHMFTIKVRNWRRQAMAQSVKNHLSVLALNPLKVRQ